MIYQTGMQGYLGNRSDMLVHHLSLMTPDCRIAEIKKMDKTYFMPDTVEQAVTEKFTPCKNCIKN